MDEQRYVDTESVVGHLFFNSDHDPAEVARIKMVGVMARHGLLVQTIRAFPAVVIPQHNAGLVLVNAFMRLIGLVLLLADADHSNKHALEALAHSPQQRGSFSRPLNDSADGTILPAK